MLLLKKTKKKLAIFVPRRIKKIKPKKNIDMKTSPKLFCPASRMMKIDRKHNHLLRKRIDIILLCLFNVAFVKEGKNIIHSFFVKPTTVSALIWEQPACADRTCTVLSKLSARALECPFFT